MRRLRSSSGALVGAASLVRLHGAVAVWTGRPRAPVSVSGPPGSGSRPTGGDTGRTHLGEGHPGQPRPPRSRLTVSQSPLELLHNFGRAVVLVKGIRVCAEIDFIGLHIRRPVGRLFVGTHKCDDGDHRQHGARRVSIGAPSRYART